MTRFKTLALAALTAGLVVAAPQAQASNFLFGMVVGMSMSGDSSGKNRMAASSLASIPLRCLMAADEATYKACRYTSMRAELQNARVGGELTFSMCGVHWAQRGLSGNTGRDQASMPDRACDIDFHLDLELAALRQLNAQLEAETRAD
jgi:hypothetical protein